MKALNYIACSLLVVILFSCGNINNPQCRKWKLSYNNNDGYTGGSLYCDSLTMLSKTEAIIWVDGVETKIIAEALFPITADVNCH